MTFVAGTGIFDLREVKWQPVGESNPSSQVENLVS